MEISASSCYQLFNGEFLGRPWCYQLDMYTSTHLDKVAVALYSEVPYSFALLGVVAQEATLWGIRAEQHQRLIPSYAPDPFLSSVSFATSRYKVVGLMGRRCEPWHLQPLTRGDVDSSDCSCSRICNGEAIGRPWCSQIDVYTSAYLIIVAVAL